MAWGLQRRQQRTNKANEAWRKGRSALGRRPRLERLESRQLMAADFNGDGFDDLAIALTGQDLGAAVDAGAVRVSYGSILGLTGAAQYLDEATFGVAPVAGDSFGAAMATGDFDGDGFDDLAISAPSADVGAVVDAGVVYVMFGSMFGLTPAATRIWTQDSAGVPDISEAGDGFGKSLTAGDFNGDGRDDLAIGVPGEDLAFWADGGAVNVIYGGGLLRMGLFHQFWHENTGMILDVVQAGDAFGSSVTAGDFNGDGFDDLAVGVPGQDIGAAVDAGLVHAIYGSAGGIIDVGNQTLIQGIAGMPDVAETGDNLGSVLAAGDFNTDGFDDLAIGVPLEDAGALVDSGIVHAVYGNGPGLGLMYQVWSQDSPFIYDVSEPGDQFGRSLAVGDFDGNLVADLAIGVPGEDFGAMLDVGVVNLILGRAGGLASVGNQIWFQDSIGILDVNEAFDLFGASVAAGDFDGDGNSDLSVGVPGEDVLGVPDAGAVDTLYGLFGFGLTDVGDQFWDEVAWGGVLGAGDRMGGPVC